MSLNPRTLTLSERVFCTCADCDLGRDECWWFLSPPWTNNNAEPFITLSNCTPNFWGECIYYEIYNKWTLPPLNPQQFLFIKHNLKHILINNCVDNLSENLDTAPLVTEPVHIKFQQLLYILQLSFTPIFLIWYSIFFFSVWSYFPVLFHVMNWFPFTFTQLQQILKFTTDTFTFTVDTFLLYLYTVYKRYHKNTFFFYNTYLFVHNSYSRYLYVNILQQICLYLQ